MQVSGMEEVYQGISGAEVGREEREKVMYYWMNCLRRPRI